MRYWIVSFAVGAAALFLAATAEAATKAYDSSIANGSPGDRTLFSFNLCPPIATTPNILEGSATIDDDALGTVTLNDLSITVNTVTDLGADQLTSTFGPGAFIFTFGFSTLSITSPSNSNSSGVGAHGPSGTAPGASAEWGVISGFSVTGVQFCISSPVSICNENVVAHGTTAQAILNSPTYDLGTWAFDAVGDYESDPYIFVTANGGLTNGQQVLRGAFHGTSLPALPLIGFGALACALVAVGGRALRASR